MTDDSTRGVYRKFNVTRTDGSSGEGGKHEHCAYFVLDLAHDDFALPALKAYAKACRSQFPELARDIEAIVITRPCGCRSVGECFHWGPQTPSEALDARMASAEEKVKAHGG